MTGRNRMARYFEEEDHARGQEPRKDSEQTLSAVTGCWSGVSEVWGIWLEVFTQIGIVLLFGAAIAAVVSLAYLLK